MEEHSTHLHPVSALNLDAFFEDLHVFLCQYKNLGLLGTFCILATWCGRFSFTLVVLLASCADEAGAVENYDIILVADGELLEQLGDNVVLKPSIFNVYEHRIESCHLPCGHLGVEGLKSRQPDPSFCL